jgi:N-acetylmuramoyl-L-alanine amidase
MGLGLRRLQRWAAGLLAALALVTSAAAQDAQGLGALTQVVPGGVRSLADPQGARLEVDLTRAVPWRLSLLDDPPRLVAEFRTLDTVGLATAGGGLIAPHPPAEPGWTGFAHRLAGPARIASAELRTGPADGTGATLAVVLSPVAQESFAALLAPARPAPAVAAPPVPAPPVPAPSRPVIVLDPGHGGADVGATHGGVSEADLMLGFARELREAFLRDGAFDVVLTREADDFVGLDSRIARAHAAGGAIMISLHADALDSGEATGATVYTFATEASDEASARLAAAHDRAELLVGVDLAGQDDTIADVLMDLARTETEPRSAALAASVVGAIGAEGLILHRAPLKSAAFSVLKSADIPSVLIELGYLSSRADRARLVDPAWRARMARAIVAAVNRWSQEDAALRAQMRR